jgi:hypothetical protein
MEYQVKIGLVPLRRDVTARPGAFNWERAEARCADSVNYIKEHFTSDVISFVDLEGINDVGVLYSEKDVAAIVDRFKKASVDAVFLINGNFGNEEAAGKVMSVHINRSMHNILRSFRASHPEAHQ